MGLIGRKGGQILIWDFLKIRFQYILAPRAKMYWNVIFKKSQICPIWWQFDPIWSQTWHPYSQIIFLCIIMLLLLVLSADENVAAWWWVIVFFFFSFTHSDFLLGWMVFNSFQLYVNNLHITTTWHNSKYFSNFLW